MPTLRDPAKQRAGVFLWSAVLIILFSILMNLFKLKNGCESLLSFNSLLSLAGADIGRLARLFAAYPFKLLF